MDTALGLVMLCGKFALPLTLSLGGLGGAVVIGHGLGASVLGYLGLYFLITAGLTVATLAVGVAYESVRG
jgi:hypothetical protein